MKAELIFKTLIVLNISKGRTCSVFVLLGPYVYFYLLVYLMLFNSVDYSQMIG